jgi:hypothetical protein
LMKVKVRCIVYNLKWTCLRVLHLLLQLPRLCMRFLWEGSCLVSRARLSLLTLNRSFSLKKSSGLLRGLQKLSEDCQEKLLSFFWISFFDLVSFLWTRVTLPR